LCSIVCIFQLNHGARSPKLAASAADLSSPYPDSALGFGAVCHLVVSALTCWPLYGWTPGLFHSLLANVQATSLLALGPKETCSLLCLLVRKLSLYSTSPNQFCDVKQFHDWADVQGLA